MIARLSLMMLLNYAVIGAWAPVFGPYLKGLGLTYRETAWIWSTAAIASTLAPIVWGQIADRWISAERCISSCAAFAGVTLWAASRTVDPWSLFWLSLAFWMFQMPMLSIGAALTFRQLERPERQFGPIRLWGTVGWMAAGWAFTVWLKLFDGRLVDSLRMGAIAAWILAIYALTLPTTPPAPATLAAAHHGPWRRLVDAPLRALRLFQIPAFAVYCFCLFVVYVSWAFNMQMTGLLISGLLDDPAWLPTTLSVAQITEVASLAALPMILERFGQKRTMVVGIGCWALALAAFAIGRPAWLVIPSLLLHGVYICCFLVAGQVFVNRIAHHDFRASAQGVLVLVNGLGQFAGNFVVGALREETGDDYSLAFLPAAIGVAALTGFFAAAFTPPPAGAPSPR